MYENKNLGIKIGRAEHFSIVENDNSIDLLADETLRFRVLKNSTVEAYNSSTVRACDSSTVEAYNSSTVVAHGSSRVWAYDSSRVTACDSSTVEACDSSRVTAHGSSRVTAYDSSIVTAYGSSTVTAYGSSTVKAYNSSTVRACDSSTVEAYNSSTVEAYNSSTVVAYGSSRVWAYDSSTVRACDSSTVTAYNFSCVFVKSGKAKINTVNHFGCIIGPFFTVKKKTTVYKKLLDGLIAELELVRGQIFQSENHDKCRTDRAVVRRITSIDGKTEYQKGFSQHDQIFAYRVGEVVSADYDKEIKECSTGIHFFLTREEAEKY